MIPLDLTITLALLSFGLGCLVGACLVRRVRPRWPRFDHDMRGLVPLSGASEAYFVRDFSDKPEIRL